MDSAVELFVDLFSQNWLFSEPPLTKRLIFYVLYVQSHHLLAKPFIGC